MAKRLAGLDIFRGLAVAGMIVVNNPGSGDHVWWPLDHAAWHGFTPTDLVFPAFLCAMGVALGLGFPRAIAATERRVMWGRIVRRSVVLIALGIGFGILARLSFADIRLFGVLQRIGLCYFVAASLAMLTARPQADGHHALSARVIGGAAFGCVILYAALLLFAPVPGYGAGQLTPEGNIAGYVDRTLFTTAHIWRWGTGAAGAIVYDPEGLLSTLPALANVLFGVVAGIAWRRAPDRALGWIVAGGVALTILGLAVTPLFPLNKRIWTPSFALFTTGLSALLLALATIAVRSDTARRLLGPFHVLGMNAILGYILSLLLGILGLHAIVPHAGGAVTLPQWGFERIDALLHTPLLSSALYGVLLLALVLLALLPLHRRGIHLRL
jgi:predicted acyltransferase